MLNPCVALLGVVIGSPINHVEGSDGPPSPPHTTDQSDTDGQFRFDPALCGDSILTLQFSESGMINQQMLEASAPPDIVRFGAADTRSWTINSGVGTNFHNRAMARAGIGLSHFIADDFSLDFELNGLYFDQPGDNAAGVNLTMLIRYHFWHDESRAWSLYGDAGAGLLVTNDEVPADGSSFNFTPQLGVGASFDVGNHRRLFVGGRWHHISNANTFEDNPAADFLFIYAMIGFSF